MRPGPAVTGQLVLQRHLPIVEGRRIFELLGPLRAIRHPDRQFVGVFRHLARFVAEKLITALNHQNIGSPSRVLLHGRTLAISPVRRDLVRAEVQFRLIQERLRDVECAVQQELRLDAELPVVAQLAGIARTLNLSPGLSQARSAALPGFAR